MEDVGWILSEFPKLSRNLLPTVPAAYNATLIMFCSNTTLFEEHFLRSELFYLLYTTLVTHDPTHYRHTSYSMNT
jgi:hypothetical protein